MPTPKPEALLTAALWLEAYEAIDGNDQAAADCAQVAKWLRSKADACELRLACKAAGVPLQVARRALRKSARPPSGGGA